MRRRDFIAFLGVAAVWSQQAHAQQALIRKTFALGDTSFAIFLPEAAVVGRSAGGDKVTFDLTKGERLERSLTLATAPPEPGASADRDALLANGSRFEYAVEDDIGGGSGGPIARLSGRLAIGAHVLSVTCTDQDEWSREPAWCRPYLARLEVVKP